MREELRKRLDESLGQHLPSIGQIRHDRAFRLCVEDAMKEIADWSDSIPFKTIGDLGVRSQAFADAVGIIDKHLSRLTEEEKP